MHITGLSNNVAFLRRIVTSPSFAKADLDTALIERERDVLFTSQRRPAHGDRSLVAAMLVSEGTLPSRPIRPAGSTPGSSATAGVCTARPAIANSSRSSDGPSRHGAVRSVACTPCRGLQLTD